MATLPILARFRPQEEYILSVFMLCRAKTHAEPLTWHFAVSTLLCGIR